ncbi:MAG: hypothetical protein KME31_13215 [Tolypothrix carrinoi HA7290-LM1]|jgi:hypothetical protein|nr:hypothetical protein [Tolypothrix carrinoi HA7290-LM1]
MLATDATQMYRPLALILFCTRSERAFFLPFHGRCSRVSPTPRPNSRASPPSIALDRARRGLVWSALPPLFPLGVQEVLCQTVVRGYQNVAHLDGGLQAW